MLLKLRNTSLNSQYSKLTGILVQCTMLSTPLVTKSQLLHLICSLIKAPQTNEITYILLHRLTTLIRSIKYGVNLMAATIESSLPIEYASCKI